MHKAAILTALILVVSGVIGNIGTRTAKAGKQQAGSYIEYLAAKRAVCYYFGKECKNAMAVVKCETAGTYSPWATNGQYVNIFQMGYSERKRFGWHSAGSSVWKAAKAAKGYYDYEVRNGKWGWTPWSCKP